MLSNQLAYETVMKNYDPLVSGPALAIESVKGSL